MEKKVYSTSGKELRTITLDDKVFGLPVNDDVIYYAITNELANKRVGTACTKTRSEVHAERKLVIFSTFFSCIIPRKKAVIQLLCDSVFCNRFHCNELLEIPYINMYIYIVQLVKVLAVNSYLLVLLK